MPTNLNLQIDALRRVLVSILAYAVAMAVVAGTMLPTLLHADPVATLLPKPPPTVARSPHPAPLVRAAL